MRKKLLSLVILCTLGLALVALANPTAPVFADVGNQNDYGSSSDWGSGSSDGGGSSWDNDYDSDYSYGSSDSSSGGGGGGSESPAELAITFVLLIIIIALAVPAYRFLTGYASSRTRTRSDYGRESLTAPPVPDQYAIEAQIKTGDPHFNAELFKGWVKELFLMLNEAWTERSWGKIRRFESNALFNEHRMLLDKYLEKGEINFIEQIGIKEVDLREFRRDEHFEYLTVTLHAQLIDYVVDERTGSVIRGSKTSLYHMLYTLKFARTLGSQSPDSLENVGITKCPNCGASMEISVSGECEYCHSIVTSGQYNWVLCSYTGQNIYS